jgi:tripartite-type tricarboxylate transporter receptor subunit TctC
MNRTRRHLLLGASALALAPHAHAQNAAGSTVRLVVPFPPGGLLDGVGRLIAPVLGSGLSQTVVVDNKPGSGGNIGTDIVAKAAPDGLTWLLGSPGLAISPSLYPKLPYKPEDLQPVALLGGQPNVLLVPSDSPARKVADLIDMLQKAPGKYQYASNGNGTSLHLSAELLKFKTRSFVLHVPYRGSAPAMTALLSGEVNFMFDNLSPALPQIQAGRCARWPSLPPHAARPCRMCRRCRRPGSPVTTSMPGSASWCRAARRRPWFSAWKPSAPRPCATRPSWPRCASAASNPNSAAAPTSAPT